VPRGRPSANIEERPAGFGTSPAIQRVPSVGAGEVACGIRSFEETVVALDQLEHSARHHPGFEARKEKRAKRVARSLGRLARRQRRSDPQSSDQEFTILLSPRRHSRIPFQTPRRTAGQGAPGGTCRQSDSQGSAGWPRYPAA
jgi:hypothetical protein